MHAKLSTLLRTFLTVSSILCCGQAFAGSLPLITDDADTPGAGGWEINFAVNVEHDSDRTDVEVPLFEINHGFTDRDELRIEFSVITDNPDDEHDTTGISDLLIGYKYRFIDQCDHGWDVSIFPQITCPTGDEDRNLGTGDTQLLIPFEFTKHFCCNKAWINYEAGYNSSFGDRPDGWKFGMSGGREVSDKLEVLGEVGAFVFNGGDEEHDNPFFNLGFKYRLNCNVKLIGSAGRSFRSEEDTPNFFCLVGLQVLLGRAAEHRCCETCGEEACGCEGERNEKAAKPKEAYAAKDTAPTKDAATAKDNAPATEESASKEAPASTDTSAAKDAAPVKDATLHEDAAPAAADASPFKDSGTQPPASTSSGETPTLDKPSF